MAGSARRVPILAVVALAACSSSGGLEIDRDHDPLTDFATYSTFAWSTDSGGVVPNALIDEFTDVRIRQAVDRELEAVGWTRVTREAAQVTVGYRVELERVAERAVGDPRAADVNRYGGVYDSSPSDRWFEQGTLEIGIVDPSLNRVVWRGTARAELDPVTEAADREARINRIVRTLFQDFPPG